MTQQKNVGRKDVIKEAIEDRGSSFSKLRDGDKFSISEIAAYFRGKRGCVMGIPSYEYRNMSMTAKTVYGREVDNANSVHLAARLAEMAEKMGVTAESLGRDFEDACSNVENAAKKLFYKNTAYERPENAVVSIVLNRNSRDDAISVLDSMNSDAEIVVNVSKMLKFAKDLGLEITDFGKYRNEAVDSIVRNSISVVSFKPKVAVAKTIIEQRPEDAVGIVMNIMLPELSDSDAYSLSGFVKGLVYQNKIKEGNVLLGALQGRVIAGLAKIEKTGTE